MRSRKSMAAPYARQLFMPICMRLMRYVDAAFNTPPLPARISRLPPANTAAVGFIYSRPPSLCQPPPVLSAHHSLIFSDAACRLHPYFRHQHHCRPPS